MLTKAIKNYIQWSPVIPRPFIPRIRMYRAKTMAPNTISVLFNLSDNNWVYKKLNASEIDDLIIQPYLNVKPTNHRACWGDTPLQEPIRSKHYLSSLQTLSKRLNSIKISVKLPLCSNWKNKLFKRIELFLSHLNNIIDRIRPYEWCSNVNLTIFSWNLAFDIFIKLHVMWI